MVSFTACRNKPEVVVPARATPREVKILSDIDNQLEVRLYASSVEFFQVSLAPEELAGTLKDALAEALVYYYPMAGRLRLRELPGGGERLVVDCTAEGAMLVEAHADVRLEELGKPLVKPHPCIEELTFDVGDVRAVVGKPLLYLQMTHLRCGGLVLALTVCHSVVDAVGMYQILRCIIDLARGQALPDVLPTWERQLLVSSTSPEEAPGPGTTTALPPPPPPPLHDEMMPVRYFVFGIREMAALRSAVPAGLSPTVFELITAAVWRCWAAALQHAPNETVRLIFMVNMRRAWKLPPGYYGNAICGATAEARAAELCGGPLQHAVRLVREAKLRITEQQVSSVPDIIASGRKVALQKALVVTDVTRCGGDPLDIGSWAQHVGGGPAMAMDVVLSRSSGYTSCKDVNGEECVLVPMCLPEVAMGRFTSQIAAVTNMFARSPM